MLAFSFALQLFALNEHAGPLRSRMAMRVGSGRRNRPLTQQNASVHLTPIVWEMLGKTI